MSQLLLQCGSAASGAIYTRLLQRCLLIAVSALEVQGEGEEEGEVSCVVPGAGANEVMWSALWAQVGQALTAAAVPPHPHPHPHPQQQSLALLVARRVSARLAEMSGSEGPALVAATIRTAAVCRALAEAFLQPPLLLLRNHAADGGLGESGIQRTLLQWRRSYSEPGAGRPQDGWITFIGKHTGPLSEMQDCFLYGIVGNSRQFWYTLLVCLDSCTTHLRIDGQAMSVKRAKSTSLHLNRRTIIDQDDEED